MLEYAPDVKLRFSDEEAAWLGACAELLMASFKELENAKTDDVLPLVTVLDAKNVLRADISNKMLTREELLGNAPEQYDGCFEVPRTLE